MEGPPIQVVHAEGVETRTRHPGMTGRNQRLSTRAYPMSTLPLSGLLPPSLARESGDCRLVLRSPESLQPSHLPRSKRSFHVPSGRHEPSRGLRRGPHPPPPPCGIVGLWSFRRESRSRNSDWRRLGDVSGISTPRLVQIEARLPLSAERRSEPQRPTRK